MKQVVNVGIGGRSFVLDNDAYLKLDSYLKKFKESMESGVQKKEVMEDLEERIAELFTENLGTFKDVVDINLVNMVIAQLGMPNGEPFIDENCDNGTVGETYSYKNTPRKFYRDPDNKAIGGICSGLAIYFNIDIVLVRILFVIGFIMGSASFWIYIVLWIAAPLAATPAQKCEMYGLPITAENLNRFSK